MYSRKVAGQVRDFGVTGKLWHGVLVMFDRQTGSYWTQLDGRSIQGSSSGAFLEHIPSTFTTYGAWRVAHPETLVVQKTEEERNLSASRYAGYFKSSSLFTPHLAEGLGEILEGKDMVFGLRHGEHAVAVPALEIEPGQLLHLSLGDEPITLLRHSWNGRVRAVSRRLEGRTLSLELAPEAEPTETLWDPKEKKRYAVDDLPSIRVDQAFWYAWKRSMPHTKIFGE